HWGKANDGWICPDATVPPKGSTGPSVSSHYGTVGSAWETGTNSFWWWSGSGPPNTINRVGSYAANDWLTGWGWDPQLEKPEWTMTKEAQVAHTSLTPVFADGVSFWWVFPKETDLPAFNLQTGNVEVAAPSMSAVTIPRHGSRPSRVPTNQQPQAKLPGSINVSFYDGHMALVRLESLWQLEWHGDWQAPAKRPGL
ncbi:MAG: hypothetical protein ACREP9_12720, partial [Candidatus Dormibacteraceae bacterium]